MEELDLVYMSIDTLKARIHNQEIEIAQLRDALKKANSDRYVGQDNQGYQGYNSREANLKVACGEDPLDPD